MGRQDHGFQLEGNFGEVDPTFGISFEETLSLPPFALLQGAIPYSMHAMHFSPPLYPQPVRPRTFTSRTTFLPNSTHGAVARVVAITIQGKLKSIEWKCMCIL